MLPSVSVSQISCTKYRREVTDRYSITQMLQETKDAALSLPFPCHFYFLGLEKVDSPLLRMKQFLFSLSVNRGKNWKLCHSDKIECRQVKQLATKPQNQTVVLEVQSKERRGSQRAHTDTPLCWKASYFHQNGH